MNGLVFSVQGLRVSFGACPPPFLVACRVGCRPVRTVSFGVHSLKESSFPRMGRGGYRKALATSCLHLSPNLKPVRCTGLQQKVVSLEAFVAESKPNKQPNYATILLIG